MAHFSGRFNVSRAASGPAMQIVGAAQQAGRGARRRAALGCVLACAVGFSAFAGFTGWCAEVAAAPELLVTLDRDTAEAALPMGADGRLVSGRLYVLFSTLGSIPPIRGPNWFRPEPFFATNVARVRPGDVSRLDNAADGFPTELAKVAAGSYRVQAILDHSEDAQHHSDGVGNFYSDPIAVAFDPSSTESIRLTLNRVVEERPFPQAPWLHEVVLRSDLLSRFHGREVVERATVVLPAGYDDDPHRRYPAVYEIPGFGGTHRPRSVERASAPAADEGEAPCIRVLLSGNCKWGHHVYADSATNGPRGAALVREMIPHVDAHFRTVAADTGRFVTGHSSGGWSSLWLQVTYPEVFGGVWSTSPDPVDFHDFQQVDLYADPPVSLYYDAEGKPRPLARRGTEPTLFFPSFGRMDDVLSRGGQLRSFEAVFSPRGEDGMPRRLWNRETGRIDPEVVRYWEQYDIGRLLAGQWERLGPRLQGKLHITTGGLDSFYLNGAVEKLAATLKGLGSDAEIVILPGKGHSDLLTAELRHTIRRQISQAYWRHHPR